MWVRRVLTFRGGRSVAEYIPVDADVSAVFACCSVQFLRESGGLNTYVSPLLVRV